MKSVIGACLLLVSGCSAGIGSGLQVVCYTENDPCPDDLPYRVMEKFGDNIPGFDTEEDLTVLWYDHDALFDIQVDGQTRKAYGFSEPWKRTMSVTDDAVMVHELMHVHLYRYTGDGDVNHAKAPGPWTEETDGLVLSITGQVRD